MSVVDAVAVEAVIEASADCTDRDRAEAALAAALSASRAPRRSESSRARAWRLEMRVTAVAPGMKLADAHIRDDAGRPVAERSVSDKTAGSCVALAHAVGAWAQIVLDDELARAHDAPPPEVPAVPSSPRQEAPAPLRPPPIVAPPVASATVPSDDDGPGERSTRPSQGRTFELGTMLILRNGVASTGGIFGASPFATMTFHETWVLRPSLLIGTSTSRVPPDQSRSANVTMLGGRVDVCRRMPGNYIDHRGIEVDACAGGDLAYAASELQQAVRASLGPSGILRGELGQNFGLELRTMLGVNLARGGFGEDAPFFVASAELGGSVRFR